MVETATTIPLIPQQTPPQWCKKVGTRSRQAAIRRPTNRRCNRDHGEEQDGILSTTRCRIQHRCSRAIPVAAGSSSRSLAGDRITRVCISLVLLSLCCCCASGRKNVVVGFQPTFPFSSTSTIATSTSKATKSLRQRATSTTIVGTVDVTTTALPGGGEEGVMYAGGSSRGAWDMGLWHRRQQLQQRLLLLSEQQQAIHRQRKRGQQRWNLLQFPTVIDEKENTSPEEDYSKALLRQGQQYQNSIPETVSQWMESFLRSNQQQQQQQEEQQRAATTTTTPDSPVGDNSLPLNSKSIPMRNGGVTRSEMVSVTAVAGVAFSFAVIYLLAMSGEGGVLDVSTTSEVLLETTAAAETSSAAVVSSLLKPSSAEPLTLAVVGNLERVGANVIDATIPMTADDVLAVALGEGFGAIVGAATSLGLSAGFVQVSRWMADMTAQARNRKADAMINAVPVDTNNVRENRAAARIKIEAAMRAAASATASTTGTTTNERVVNAVADGEFLFARAAALPLLTTFGLPPAVASVAAILLASVPSELVKVLGRQRQALEEENMELERLLQQQQEEQRREQWKKQWGLLSFAIPAATTISPSSPSLRPRAASAVTTMTAESGAATVDPETLIPVREPKENVAVEIFSDVTKWLEYDVLSRQFGDGKLLAPDGLPLFPGVESALFGAVSSLSAQVYADLLYAYFGWGGELKRDEVRSRRPLEWITMYTSRCIGGASLFGMYELAQIPAKAMISAVLSGGLDGCLGSEDYQLCIESYLASNPPAASPEAQFRALVTAVASLMQQLTQFLHNLHLIP